MVQELELFELGKQIGIGILIVCIIVGIIVYFARKNLQNNKKKKYKYFK